MRDIRLALTEDEIVSLFEFVKWDLCNFRKLYRFLAELAQAPIYRGEQAEIFVLGPQVASTEPPSPDAAPTNTSTETETSSQSKAGPE